MQQTKIAFVTDDGKTISAHFGRAQFYEVITLEDKQEVRRERLPKAGHYTFGAHEHNAHGQGEEGRHAGEHQAGDHQGHVHKHETMTAPIADCAVLVARGMGMGAHQHLAAARITAILTDEQTIDAALEKFKDGTLTDNRRRLHDHGPGHGHGA
ncbi:MAG TPA: NifB/NifX family molybdenum-iron cluster-binding protein [Bacteroidota bacterium]|nr:NifB/NifX family molybdenum-iron cluster-binding protein [Bacteroidota bacterium]